MSIERKVAANNNGYPTTVYGTTEVDDMMSKGAVVGASGDQREYVAEYVIDFAEGLSQSDVDPSVLTLPAGSYITSAEVVVLETISGGTNFDLGLAEPDGTAIDADGLVAASVATAEGVMFKGAGALVGTQVLPAAQLSLAGTRTAGKIGVTVRYLRNHV